MNETPKLTATQARTVAAIEANGGYVDAWLDAFKAAGVDGRSIWALVRKGVLRRVHTGPDGEDGPARYELVR